MSYLAFVLGCIGFWVQPLFGFSAVFLAFSPYIAYLLLQYPLSKALWGCCIAGMIVDLYSDHPMGLHAVNYVMTATLLSRLSNRFLLERPLHFSLYTTLISSVSTFISLLLLFLFDRRTPFSGKWIFGDLIGMPLLDGIYALIWFFAPFKAWGFIGKYWRIFWLKRKHISLPSPK